MTAGKRLFDLTAAALGLLVLWPVFLLIAVLIKLEDGGPVFFRQERVGHRGRPFRLRKFRTMVPDASARGGPLTVGQDTRITRIGTWLRAWKLDELPQVLNVLAGEMSPVGPRPEVPRYVDLYTPEQRAVLDYVPGLTDEASIQYRNESALLARVPDPEGHYIHTVMPDKIRINLAYAARATLWTDLAVIFRTLWAVARGAEEGAEGTSGSAGLTRVAPALALAVAFLVLYGDALVRMVEEWWLVPEAGHGLLLAPIAVALAWSRGAAPGRRPRRVLGAVILLCAGGIRFAAELGASMTIVWVSMAVAITGLIVYHAGTRQLLHWWLPGTLFLLSIPVPLPVLNALAFPLQLRASQMGAALLEWRQVPVQVAGNVIRLPGHSLFVTEACSGLRSLTALLAIGVLVGGLWLRTPLSRLLLVALALPLAMVVNSIRVFFTGFLVYYGNPALADGFVHYSEGWVLFVGATALFGGVAWLVARAERRLSYGGQPA